jgi:tRNA(Ile)-lysidine synthase
LEFLRNRIRHRLLPLLRKEFNPRIDQAVLRLAEIMGEEDRWLRRHAEVLLRWLSVGAPGMAAGAARRGKRLAAAEVRLDLPAFLRQPVTLRRRLLLAAVRRSGGSLRHLGYQNVSDCLDFLSRGVRGGTVQLPGGVRVNKDSACFTVAVESAAPNKSDQQEFIPVSLPVPGKTLLPGLGLAIRARMIDTTPDGSSSSATPLLQGSNITENGVENHAISYDLRSGRREGHRFPVRPPGTGAEMKMKGIECWTACFDYDRLEAPLTVRTRRDGDRLRPFGMQGAKKLKKLLGELGVPAGDRDRIALVVSGDEIIWVAGYRRAQAAPVSTQTRHMLILEVERL